MWLTSSSIGRKFVMALTGICLVLFVTFHVLMNSVAIAWPTAYNEICRFLGANWYALAASVGLAALFIIHIFYAVWLTVQNRKARGEDRYEVNTRPPQVEWSSKNMLVLGIVILAFLVVHMIQFWYRMQWQEIVSHNPEHWTTLDGVVAQPEFGTLFLQAAFSHFWTPIVYIAGFIALWFHMNHGFWSMFQTIGWNNNTWIPRLKCISNVWTSVVVALFVAQAIIFTVQAHRNYYLQNEGLQLQYEEFWNDEAEKLLADFQLDINAAQKADNSFVAMHNFMNDKAPQYLERAKYIIEGAKFQCPNYRSLNIVAVEDLIPELNFAMQGGQPIPVPSDLEICDIEQVEGEVDAEPVEATEAGANVTNE